MATIFTIKRGDTLPFIEATLRSENGTPVNLAGATVLFKMKKPGSNAVLINRACTITDAANGVVRFAWQAGETDTIGNYSAEFEATFFGGSVETFPNDGYVTIRVVGDIR